MTQSQRLFVALFPDDSTRQRLFRLASDLVVTTSGRAVPQLSLHLTLRFLGQVNMEVVQCLEEQLGGVRATAFRLQISRLETRTRQGMIWAMPEECPEPLMALVAEIDQCSSACGVSARDHEFLPHITLARNIKRAAELQQIEPIEIVADNFQLAVSETLPEGSRYRQLHRWSLDNG